MKDTWSEENFQAVIDISDVLISLRETIVESMKKNYMVPNAKWKEIFQVCKQINNILCILQMENELFENIYVLILEAASSQGLYETQEFAEEILLLMDDCLEMFSAWIVSENKTDKRVIKIKYVDFYPEFQPKEHWLYKLLSKKYWVAFSDSPDYLFFSCFGNEYLKYDCLRIFISNEAVYPNLNLYDYAVTYSDFKITDRLLPNQDAFEELKYRKLAENINEAGDLLNGKTEFCNFVYSNGEGDCFRKELFDAVNEYKTVRAGGKFLNNIGYCVDDLEAFQSKFKFSIACENSYYKGYTTEKIINAFNARTIPIYWGNPDISDIINPKAIINCHDYQDLNSVIEEIKRLDNDDEAYKQKLMEPILVNSDMVERYLAERERFIYHIIEQPYESAFRRNMGLRGQWYNDFFCHVFGYPNEWFTPEKGYFVKKNEVCGPLVSILIPVYRHKEMAMQAIDSALNQSYRDTEIIVIDNQSGDGTYEELLKCYGNCEKVKLYRNDTNIGPVNNWKACLEKAQGKYVKFLWSDDLIGNDFVEKCVNVLEEDPTIGMVYSACFVFRDYDVNNGFLLHKLAGNTGKYSKDVFYKGMFQDEADLPVSPGCAMFRREDVAIMDSIPNELGVNCNSNGAGIDLMIFLHALDKYENFYYFDEVMSWFRYHSDSITVANNLIREYNLAKLYFCQNYKGASQYVQHMCMRILRDEGVKDEKEGVEILHKYGYKMEYKK